jgi:cytochrome c biogenesis protein CcmG/thiol:disulfide interchange protein DsbE
MTFRKSLLLPLGVFMLLVVFLALGFRLQDPHLLPSVLIDKPFPEFELKDLHDLERTLSRADMGDDVVLVNVWATWCPNCIIEHPELMRISQQEDIAIYGVNYNDDVNKALAWLERRQDPYRFSVVDDKGTLAIDLGVYGAPETFVVDTHGVIRFRFVGPVTPDIWQEKIKPVVDHLRSLGNGEGKNG